MEYVRFSGQSSRPVLYRRHVVSRRLPLRSQAHVRSFGKFGPGDINGTFAQLQETQPSVDDEDAYQGWLNRYEDVLWDDRRTHEAVCLCHEGCAYRDWLIITGPLRGQMWDGERAGDVDLAPSTANDGSTLTFGHWYLNWLDEAERTVFKTRPHS